MLNKQFFGNDNRGVIGDYLTYEMWDNFIPNKIIANETKEYFSNILSDEIIKKLASLSVEFSKKLKDPIFSLQLDKNGGATVFYQYEDERDVPPANACCKIIKPIMEDKVKKMVLADNTKSTIILHTSISDESSLKKDIKEFVSIIEKDDILEDEMVKKGAQHDIFANIFVFDKRINKNNL